MLQELVKAGCWYDSPVKHLPMINVALGSIHSITQIKISVLKRGLRSEKMWEKMALKAFALDA